MKIAVIAAAGAVGALARYGLTLALGPAAPAAFPWATYIANITGSFAAGLLVALFAHRWPGHDVLSAALLVGFLGAYTTFSAFTVQTQQLYEGGLATKAVVYVAASVLAGVAAAAVGVWFGNLFARA